MLVGSHSITVWLRGLCVQGTAHGRGSHRGGFLEKEEGKSKGWFCSSVHASPCLGKPGQGLLVFWGRNRFGWIKLSHLYFLRRNVWPFLVWFLWPLLLWPVSLQCQFQQFHPSFPCMLYQFWIFIHCFETPIFPVKELKPRVYSWLLSQATYHKWPTQLFVSQQNCLIRHHINNYFSVTSIYVGLWDMLVPYKKLLLSGAWLLSYIGIFRIKAPMNVIHNK